MPRKVGEKMMSASDLPRLITAGVIATELDEPRHRVQYVLANRRHIRPCARAGTLWLYRREAIAMVRHELKAIDARQDGREVDCG